MDGWSGEASAGGEGRRTQAAAGDDPGRTERDAPHAAEDAARAGREMPHPAEDPALDGSTTAAPDDVALVAALRAGDEAAFSGLVEAIQSTLVQAAMAFVRDRQVAEEVVQEAWVAVLKGLDRFEGRSSLRTWIYRIVTLQARTRGVRERRTVPLSSIDPGSEEPSVEPARFRSPGMAWPGHWADAPERWGPDVSERLLAQEAQQVIASTLAALPDGPRTVMTLRDVRGWTSEEVCEALEISPGNQRVLLHRARSRVRSALERYFVESERV